MPLIRLLRLCLFLCCPVLIAQTQLELINTGSLPLRAERFIGVDNFNALYYSLENRIVKTKTDGSSINYSNVQLGELGSVDIFNPLKINVFYDQFNTVIILDNRLAEIYKIDFNIAQPYRYVSLVSSGYDNAIWIFNADLQQLELYDYKTNKTRISCMPVNSEVLDLKSDYNHCWLLTSDFLYQYNYFGSLVSKTKNEGFESLAISDENLILKKADELYFKSKDSDGIIPVKMPRLLIKQFLLTNETLYIYDLEKVHTFQLKID